MEKHFSTSIDLSLGNAIILVVDDLPDNLHLLSKLLTEHGYDVRPALTGKIALEAVKHHLPDLILLDINMPEMDGYEVCRRLKADKRTRDVPVVQACTVIFAGTYIMLNLIADIIGIISNPRLLHPR